MTAIGTTEGVQLAEGTLVGFGDPLLDITADVDEAFLERFGLKDNDAIMADQRHAQLSRELCERFAPRFTAGGSAQNTLRVFQWIVRQPRIATMVGAIGHDQFGRYLEQNARICGVDIRYHYVNDDQCVNSSPGEPMTPGTAPTPSARSSSSSPSSSSSSSNASPSVEAGDERLATKAQSSLAPGTGTCCVLLTQRGRCRSLVTYKGASALYSPAHLQRIWEPVVGRARFFYVTSYFLSTNFDVVLQVAHHARTKGKVFCLNLSAPFLVREHHAKLRAILPLVDIVFGNENELDAFGETVTEDDACSPSVATTVVPVGSDVARKTPETLSSNTTDGDSGSRQRRHRTCTLLSNFLVSDDSQPRLVVITQGELPVLVAKGDSFASYPVESAASADSASRKDRSGSRGAAHARGSRAPPASVEGAGGAPSDRVDTNGAGDAFVGGFLASLISRLPIELCVRNGCIAALAIIREVGCSTPARSEVRFYLAEQRAEPRAHTITRRQISIQ